jgi:hypothetical protein
MVSLLGVFYTKKAKVKSEEKILDLADRSFAITTFFSHSPFPFRF